MRSGIGTRDGDSPSKSVDDSVYKLVDIRYCELAFRSFILTREILLILGRLLGILVFISRGNENIGLRILFDLTVELRCLDKVSECFSRIARALKVAYRIVKVT